MPAIPRLCRFLLAAGFTLTAGFAQNEAPPATSPAEEDGGMAAFGRLMASIDWVSSGSGELGGWAYVDVPEGYRFTGGDGTIRLMEAYGNLTSGGELGYLAPDNMEWFAVFEFDDCGYVKDDDKDQLDAGKLMKQMQENQKQVNEELTKRGMPTLQVRGWHTPPFYNPTTNNLEWAVRIASSDGGEVINYKTKLLGRRGVMDVVLVCDEDSLDTVVPEYQKLLAGYRFREEESYAAFTKGDKVAQYGLTGLIVGGGLLAAAKSGLLARFWKVIVVGVLAVLAVAKRFFGGLFGSRSKETI